MWAKKHNKRKLSAILIFYNVIANCEVRTFKKNNWNTFSCNTFLIIVFVFPQLQEEFILEERKSLTYSTFSSSHHRDRQDFVNQVTGLQEIHWASLTYSALCKLMGEQNERRWLYLPIFQPWAEGRSRGRQLLYALHPSEDATRALRAEHHLSLFLTFTKSSHGGGANSGDADKLVCSVL